jgi:hypothetical protein
VITTIPPAAAARANALVESVATLAREVEGGAHAGLLDGAERQALAHAAAAAQDALRAGHVWRARTTLERAPLLRIYARIGRFPPGLRDPE